MGYKKRGWKSFLPLFDRDAEMKLLKIAVVVWASLIPGIVVAQEDIQGRLDSGDVAGVLAELQTQSASSDTETAVSGMCGHAQILAAAGDYSKALDVLSEVAQKLESDRKAKKSGYHVVVAYLRANFSRTLGDLDAAQNFIKRARNMMELVKIAPDWEGFIEYEASLDFDNDNSHARRAAETAIAAFHRVSLVREEGYAELRLAELEFARNKERRAFVNYDNALRLFRTADGSQREVAQTLLTIAQKHLAGGDVKAASSRLQIAQKEIEATGSPKDLVAMFEELQKQVGSAENP